MDLSGLAGRSEPGVSVTLLLQHARRRGGISPLSLVSPAGLFLRGGLLRRGHGHLGRREPRDVVPGMYWTRRLEF